MQLILPCEPSPVLTFNFCECKKQTSSIGQVGFIGNVCLPCYQLLSVVILETDQMVKRAEENLLRWKELADKKSES